MEKKHPINQEGRETGIGTINRGEKTQSYKYRKFSKDFTKKIEVKIFPRIRKSCRDGNKK